MKFHPGSYIKDIIVYEDITIDEFANKTNVHEDILIRLINGNISLSKDIAAKLSEYTGMSVQGWLNLQRKYDYEEARMTKDELKNIIDLDKRINSKLRQLENLKDMRGSISAIDYSKDNVQCSPVNQLENSVIKIIELEDEINNDIDKLVDTKNDARILINKVEGTEGTVLEMRYLECMKWEEIAYRLNYSIQHIYRLHGEGLISINKYSTS